MSEMKHSGRIVPHATGSAESALGISTVTASAARAEAEHAERERHQHGRQGAPETSKSYTAAPTATTTIAETIATSPAGAETP